MDRRTTPTPGNSLRISCACQLDAVREATQQIRAFLEGSGLDEAEVMGWELVTIEAGNNAVKYALPPADRCPVEFVVDVGPDSVELSVRDHTPGFVLSEPIELPDPTSEHGRELFLLRQFVDSMDYLRGNAGNCMVLSRHRSRPAARPETRDFESELVALETTLEAMTDELAASYESLSAVFHFTEELSQAEIDGAFLARWFDRLSTITGIEWLVLRLISPDRARLDTVQIAPHSASLPPLELTSAPDRPRSVERSCADSLRDAWFDETRPLSADDPLRVLGPRLAGLSHPVHAGEELIAVVSTGHFGGTSPLKAGQINIIQTLSDFLGVQIRNTRLHQTELRNQLLQRDYDIASRLQQSLLPRRLPTVGPWQLRGYCRSSQQVGGDFFDVVEVGPHGLLLAVADVMGKGLPAALFATIFRTLLRSRLELAPQPATFLVWLNRQLFRELREADMFITAQLAYLETSSRTLKVAGAGHPSLLLAGYDFPCREVASSGGPLGIDGDESFEDHTFTLPPRSRILMYSDGVTELPNPEGRQLGTLPLCEALDRSTAREEPADAVLARFDELQTRFLGGGNAADDQTVLLACEIAETNPPSSS